MRTTEFDKKKRIVAAGGMQDAYKRKDIGPPKNTSVRRKRRRVPLGVKLAVDKLPPRPPIKLRKGLPPPYEAKDAPSVDMSYPSRSQNATCPICLHEVRKRHMEQHKRTNSCRAVAAALSIHGVRPQPLFSSSSSSSGGDAVAVVLPPEVVPESLVMDGATIAESALALVIAAERWEQTVGTYNSCMNIWPRILELAARGNARRLLVEEQEAREEAENAIGKAYIAPVVVPAPRSTSRKKASKRVRVEDEEDEEDDEEYNEDEEAASEDEYHEDEDEEDDDPTPQWLSSCSEPPQHEA